MSVYRLLKEVAESLRPRAELESVLAEVLDRINKEIDLHDLDAEASLGGSVAKGTFLRGDHDVDVFVRFDREAHGSDDLSELLASVMKRLGAQRLHGSRDYFQFSYHGLDIEVIPVLDIQDSSQAKNVTDVSPLHVKYLLSQDIDASEIRLAKQFCKAAGVYGAESYIRGFSGHVLDLLIIEFGSFYELVRAACSWKPPMVFDPAGHHSNPLLAIPKSKHGPLLLVDPIQPTRNAAAALDEQQLQKFIDTCKRFVREPSADFFVVEDFDEDSLLESLKQHEAWVQLYVTHDPDEKKDVAGARVRKFYERLVDELANRGFAPVSSGWHFEYQDTSVLWFAFASLLLSETETRQGPPLSETEHVQAFKDQHEDVFEEDGVLFAHVSRDLRTPHEALSRAIDEVRSQVPLEYEIVAGVLREQDR